MANNQEPWQMTFAEYAKWHWGDNWVIGRQRLEAKQHDGKVGRQITQHEYQSARNTWEGEVQFALRQGSPVDPMIAKDAQTRDKQPWEQGYAEQEQQRWEKSIEGKAWQEIDINGIACLAVKPRGEKNWTVVEKSTGARLLPPSWPGGMSAETLEGALRIVQREVIERMGPEVIKRRIAEIRLAHPQPFVVGVKSKPYKQGKPRRPRLSR
jgi:hypothetical protein